VSGEEYRSFTSPTGVAHAARPDQDGKMITLCKKKAGVESFRFWPDPGWAERVGPITCTVCKARAEKIIGRPL
jgi:hypothetical protein